MAQLAIEEDMKVVSSDGRRVGTVDCVTLDRIILAKSSHGAGGIHRSIPVAWVTAVDDQTVKLSQTQNIVRENWINAEPRSKGDESVCN